ncbi:transcription elongation factor Elf1 [Metabacillus crassostreae]|uniref:hypothetical protein n=1 Tax=Metabacillus crassostreae TaxID=929098 RepID=UPI001EF797E6|nr:hypothetical protein [Metabacillus crassostreae]MBM7603713.1 transcription elongation factor Elf1 [Metabacillus crassostreae]
MECGCGVNKVHEFKVEADIGADPIWCNQCGYNLDIEDFKISKNLEEKLMDWISQYGKWIDWSTDTLMPNATEMEAIHNANGEKLTQELATELSIEGEVVFSPSKTVMVYKINKF